MVGEGKAVEGVVFLGGGKILQIAKYAFIQCFLVFILGDHFQLLLATHQMRTQKICVNERKGRKVQM